MKKIEKKIKLVRRGRLQGSLTKRRGPKSLSEKVIIASLSNDPEKIAEVRRKFEFSTKATQERAKNVLLWSDLNQLMHKKNELTERTKGAVGEK